MRFFVTCTLLNIITMIKSRRIIWAGHVARMDRRGMLIGYWWESKDERDN
jgi:hypothetical protein